MNLKPMEHIICPMVMDLDEAKGKARAKRRREAMGLVVERQKALFF